MNMQPECTECGGNNVLRDAYAEWDIGKQEWILQNVFDHSVCESDDCDGMPRNYNMAEVAA